MPSTVIRSFNYDPEHLELTITFVTGRVYRYREVSPKLFDEFARAPSRGAFFNKHIRPRHPYRELAPGRPASPSRPNEQGG